MVSPDAMPFANLRARAAVVIVAAAVAACGDPDGRGTLGSGAGVSGAGKLSETAADEGESESDAASGEGDTTMDGDSDAGTGTSGDDSATESDSGSDTTGPPPVDCAVNPDDAACDCEAMEGGDYVLGPCDPACRDQSWRYALWVSNYNVAGTLGYGEHQGMALIGTRYSYDPRYAPTDGEAAPWRPSGSLWAMGDAVSEAQQFRARTTAPGGETYVEPVEMPGDVDDLFINETLPLTPVLAAHPVIDSAALCEEPERVIDRRFFNHGRTLAERVPNHAWDSFFWRRDLIPLEEVAAFEVARTHDGVAQGVGTAEEVGACLDVLRDGFCDARCGNCSYVLPTGFGLPFGQAPANQIQGIPEGTEGPYQVGVSGQLVNARTNYSRYEDQRIVWYVGGSSWGRAVDIVGYAPDEWPDPDLITTDPNAFMSVVGDVTQSQPIPDEYDDSFTHCVDPNAWVSSQSPILSTSLLSGRWGHNSNSDAEAQRIQFMDCGAAPVASADPLWWNESACTVCGEPRLTDQNVPTQAPCQDTTHTATSYWDVTPGAHDVDDLDLGRFTAVGPERLAAEHLSAMPDPICAWSSEPVFGM